MIHFIGVSYYLILCTIGCYLYDTSTEKMFIVWGLTTISTQQLEKLSNTTLLLPIAINTNVYNPSSGKFTAALDGTFIFHYYGLAPKNQVFLQIITHPTCISCK